MKLKGLAFFSGGKDCVYALMKTRENGIPVDILLFNEYDFPRPSVHMLNRNVVETIAKSLGLPLHTLHLEKGKEHDVLSAFFSAQDVGVLTVGDIALEEHMKWYECLCAKTGIKLNAPIWVGSGVSTFEILLEEIQSGIKAVICDVDAKVLSKNLVGQIINDKIIKELLANVDPCGENGEYHTLVVDAPIMHERIVLEDCDLLEIEDRCMLKVKKFRVEAKK